MGMQGVFQWAIFPGLLGQQQVVCLSLIPTFQLPQGKVDRDVREQTQQILMQGVFQWAIFPGLLGQQQVVCLSLIPTFQLPQGKVDRDVREQTQQI